MSNDFGFVHDVNNSLNIAFQHAADDFRLDENGMVTIDFGDEIEVVMQVFAQEQTALLWMPLCRMDHADSQMQRKALELNFFGLTPTGAYLAFDAEQGLLTFCQSAGARIASVDGCPEILANFVQGVSLARAAVLSQTPRRDTQDAVADPGDTFFVRG